MSNTIIILFSFLILSGLTESKPRRHEYSHRYETQRFQESEEENDYDDRSSDRMGPRPAVNSKMEKYYDDNDLDDEIITRNLPYPRPFQPNLEESNEDSFDNYSSGGSGRTNNQKPFRPNLEHGAHGKYRGPNNDFDRNYNRQRSYEIGDFGNGHHNVNTFNIHKKIIYID